MKNLLLKKFLKKKNSVNDFGHNYYVADGVNHRLIKNEKKVGKKGKKYHTTQNCVVCKKSNLRKQSTCHCSACNVPLCLSQLAECTKALKDCFLRYHEARHVEREFKLCMEVDESSEANKNIDDMISSDDNNSCAYLERESTKLWGTHWRSSQLMWQWVHDSIVFNSRDSRPSINTWQWWFYSWFQ